MENCQNRNEKRPLRGRDCLVAVGAPGADNGRTGQWLPGTEDRPPFAWILFMSLCCKASRSAWDCSVSQTVWIMLLPAGDSLWHTSLVSGLMSVVVLATTTGAVPPPTR